MSNIYSIKIENKPKIQKYYVKAMDGLNDFFLKNWKRNVPKIVIVNNRRTVDQLREEKTHRGIVGWSSGMQYIFILNPKNFEKESKYKYNEETLYKLIKHELTHSFYALVTGNTKPQWLNEGLCTFLADQLSDYPRPKKLDSFLEGKNIYQESGHAVKFLIEEYGKEKLLKLLNEMKSNGANNFNKLFESIYGFELRYENFKILD